MEMKDMPYAAGTVWKACKDPQSGETYYVNQANNEQSWSYPTEPGAIVEQDDAAAHDPQPDVLAQKLAQLKQSTVPQPTAGRKQFYPQASDGQAFHTTNPYADSAPHAHHSQGAHAADQGSGHPHSHQGQQSMNPYGDQGPQRSSPSKHPKQGESGGWYGNPVVDAVGVDDLPAYNRNQASAPPSSSQKGSAASQADDAFDLEAVKKNLENQRQQFMARVAREAEEQQQIDHTKMEAEVRRLNMQQQQSVRRLSIAVAWDWCCLLLPMLVIFVAYVLEHDFLNMWI